MIQVGEHVPNVNHTLTLYYIWSEDVSKRAGRLSPGLYVEVIGGACVLVVMNSGCKDHGKDLQLGQPVLNGWGEERKKCRNTGLKKESANFSI